MVLSIVTYLHLPDFIWFTSTQSILFKLKNHAGLLYMKDTTKYLQNINMLVLIKNGIWNTFSSEHVSKLGKQVGLTLKKTG